VLRRSSVAVDTAAPIDSGRITGWPAVRYSPAAASGVQRLKEMDPIGWTAWQQP